MTLPSEDDPEVGRQASAGKSGYAISRFNALRHGLLSAATVLPWEDPAEYQDLLEALAAEHRPVGPTEQHLLEELAGVLWRKRRLRLAEVAAYHRGLSATTDSYSKTSQAALVLAAKPPPKVDVAAALRDGPADTEREYADLDADREMTLAALEILDSDHDSAYERALETLNPGTREAWQEQLAWTPADYGPGETPYAADGESLSRYLREEILPWYDRTKLEVAAQPLVRAQAFAESLDPDRLEKLGRYEVHLDRKFERMLSMLLRLQDLRRGRQPPETA